MDNKRVVEKIEEWATGVFLCASFLVVVFLTQALLITWLNQFQAIYVFICLVISLVLTALFFRLIKNDLKVIPHLNIAVLSIITLICLIIILFPHDSLGGRDEGTYSGLAVILSKHQNISVPSYLFKTPLSYGTYDQTFILTTPTYVVWLGVQKLLFGIAWMLRSNVILVFLGLCSLFLASSFITKRRVALTTVLLFSTCMPFVWFSRETMTENMAFFLLWFLILSLFLFIKTKRYHFLICLFFSSWLFSSARSEGLFIQISVLIVLSAVLFIRKVFSKKKILFISLIYVFLISLSFIVTNNFSPLNKNPQLSGTIELFTQQPLSKSGIVILGEKIPFFVFKMASKQNLSIVLYSFILLSVLVIVRKKIVKDRVLYICLLGIISVEFLKLVNPGVNFEQPWMYRRFLYALLPLGYLSLLILLNNLLKRKLFILIFCSLLIVNIVLSGKIIPLKNNWSITEKIDKLTQGISKEDFVIIEGEILGNYYLTSYMAYNKEIRSLYTYWIEIGDWQPEENKYQGISYSRLFLITDDENKKYKDFKLKKIKETKIDSRQLIPNCNLTMLRKELSLKTYNVSYFPYSKVIKYCNKTDNEIINLKRKLVLYELL